MTMTKSEKVAKWVIRFIIALPMSLLLIVMGVGSIVAGGPAWAILPLLGLVVVCIAIWHAEQNYGIGWPTFLRIGQVALIWLVALLVCIAINWDGKVSFGRMSSSGFWESVKLLLAIISPFMAIVSSLMLFFAPGRSLFQKWPRPGEYDPDATATD